MVATRKLTAHVIIKIILPYWTVPRHAERMNMRCDDNDNIKNGEKVPTRKGWAANSTYARSCLYDKEQMSINCQAGVLRATETPRH